ncbi:MAG: hypothetical protein Kow00108_23990 [Calditrichia bacterium]
MKSTRIRYSFILVLFYYMMAFGQIITSEPPFPTVNDSIVIYYDATQGDQGLMNYTGDVYAHTGLITSNSSGPSDWKYVVSDWGENLPQTRLERISTNLYKLTIGNIYDYYNVPEGTGEKILRLAFVFRSATEVNGSWVTGRDVGGTDIFYDLYEPGITAVLINPIVNTEFEDPLNEPVFVHTSLDVQATAATIGTQIQTISIYLNDGLISQQTVDTLNEILDISQFQVGANTVDIIVADTGDIRDTLTFIAFRNPEQTYASVPEGVEPGINYMSPSSVTLYLFAPYKDFVYVLGDFNNWQVNANYMMNKDSIAPDSVLYWLTVDNLTPGTQYGFQYFVDGEIRVGDPYSELVLDPHNDPYIDDVTFPNLKPYPTGKTKEYVSVMEPGRTPFTWTATDYQRPPVEKLVVYELLVRDFIEAHNYQTLIDTLDYLQRLGVNAIELMPVMEFDGNISWGYNPAFHTAVDKYYGTPEALKQFIDEAHKRNMAVILDMVLNHAFGQNPLVRLYNNGGYSAPTAENPWLNTEARHPFNVGYDFNHESEHTKYYVDRVNTYWLTEFKVDGFRFDLSKGFTQFYSGDNVGLWGQYDASRIAILKRMADAIWSVDDSAYVILEHFAVNAEETELANYGMLLWNNMNYNYAEASMGYIQNSDFSWGYYKNRGWNVPNHVVYMESHDEEWINYKNQAYGDDNPTNGYNIRELATALNRMKLLGAFFFTVPGPRMMWQFEELGYDETLEQSPTGRTGEKPIHWEYLQDTLRKNLYETYRWMLKLRNENEVFTSTETNVDMRVGNNEFDRRMNLSHPSMNVTIIGNFALDTMMVNPNFQTTGVWYDYFANDSIQVEDTQDPIKLRPGEFKIYTSKKLESPPEDYLLNVEDLLSGLPQSFQLEQNYPNPFNPVTTIPYTLDKAGEVTMTIYNLQGQKVKSLVRGFKSAGSHTIVWNGTDDNGHLVGSGLYFYTLKQGNRRITKKMIFVK